MKHTNSIKSILSWQSTQVAVAPDLKDWSLQEKLIFPNQAAYVVDGRNGIIVEAADFIYRIKTKNGRYKKVLRQCISLNSYQ